MAKFVLVTSQLMKRIFSRVGGSNKTFQDVEKGMEGFLATYKGSRGKLPPEDKWPVPKSLFDRLAAEAKVKPKTVDASIKAEGFDADTANDRARGRSKRSMKAWDEARRAGNLEVERMAREQGRKAYNSEKFVREQAPPRRRSRNQDLLEELGTASDERIRRIKEGNSRVAKDLDLREREKEAREKAARSKRTPTPRGVVGKSFERRRFSVEESLRDSGRGL